MKLSVSKNDYYLIYASEYNTKYRLIAVCPDKISAETYCKEFKTKNNDFKIEKINMFFYEKNGENNANE